MAANEELIVHMFCKNCGAAYPPQARFCPICGRSTQSQDQSAGQPLKAGNSTSPARPERVLKGRYRVVKHIGSGGYGEVYKAEDTEFGDRLVAIKEMGTSGMSADEVAEAADAFKREAFLLARLTHPGLPSIFDYFTEDGRWFLVMSFVEGVTLEDYLEHASRKRLSVAEVIQIGIQLCSVLGYLHTRQPPIIFRDLKPSNIMRTPDGQIYLIDFGIARIFKQGQTKDTVALGSPGFAAPEQYGKKQSSPQTDIYSLGATLHYLMSGQDPSATPFVFARLDVPEYLGLNELLLAMVDTDIRKRPTNMVAVKQGLERIARECPPGVYVKDAKPRPTPPSEQRRIVAQPAPRPRKPVSVDEVMDRRRMLHPSAYRPHQAQVQVVLPRPATPPISPARPGEKLEVYYPLPRKKPLSRRAMIIGGATITAGTLLFCSAFTALMRAVSSNNVADAQDPAAIPTIDTGNMPPDVLHNGALAVSWSPDGKRFALAEADMNGVISIYNAQGMQQWTITGHTGKISALAWSPDGAYLASGSYDTTVRIWHVDSKQMLYQDDNHTSRIVALAWSPDGQWIASSGEYGPVWMWSGVANSFGANAWTAAFVRADGAQALAFSPDGKYLAAQFLANNEVRLLDVRGRAVALNLAGGEGAIAWSSDGYTLAYANGDVVHIGTFSDGKWSGRGLFSLHQGRISAVVWSPDGMLVASAAWDSTVRVWNPKNWEVLKSFALEGGQAALSLSWSKNNQLVASDSAGRIHLWDI